MLDFRFRSFISDLKDRLPVVQKNCAMPSCTQKGEFKAPKSRYNLRDYYWFCLEHVREYNQKWDYFKGMTPGEMENYIRNTTVWDRPTWRSTEAGVNDEQKMRDKIYAHFTTGESVFGEFSGERKTEEEARIPLESIPHPTIEALAVLGLTPPVDWDQVKSHYKSLAKKYHPDTNKNDKKAEELLKKINLAYTILKLSHQHFTAIKDKT